LSLLCNLPPSLEIQTSCIAHKSQGRARAGVIIVKVSIIQYLRGNKIIRISRALRTAANSFRVISTMPIRGWMVVRVTNQQLVSTFRDTNILFRCYVIALIIGSFMGLSSSHKNTRITVIV